MKTGWYESIRVAGPPRTGGNSKA